MTSGLNLWRQMHREGLVDDEQPPSDAPETPWPARLLTGAAAWIATPLLLVFVALLMADFILEESAGLVIGALMCAAVIVPLRRTDGSEFLQQGATIVSIAGIALIGYGLSAGLDLSDRVVAGSLLVVSAALCAASRVYVHQFMCALAVVFAALWLLDGSSSQRLALLQPLLAWIAVALWWLDQDTDPQHALRDRLPPLAWATALVAVALAWFGSGPSDASVSPVVAAAVRYAGALLLPVAALVLANRSLRHDDRRLFLALVAASVVLAWLWRGAPGITVSLALMLVAFAGGRAVLFAVSVLSLAVYLVAYYYQLAVPLLDKALWLGLAGALLLILHLALRLRSRRAPP